MEGSLATMHADVVIRAALFRECVSTLEAHEETAGGFALCEQLDVSLIHSINILIIVRIDDDFIGNFLVIFFIVVFEGLNLLVNWPIPWMAVVLVGNHVSFDEVDRVFGWLWSVHVKTFWSYWYYFLFFKSPWWLVSIIRHLSTVHLIALNGFVVQSLLLSLGFLLEVGWNPAEELAEDFAVFFRERLLLWEQIRWRFEAEIWGFSYLIGITVEEWWVDTEYLHHRPGSTWLFDVKAPIGNLTVLGGHQI